MNIRIGLGTDIHRLITGKQLILGGIPIASSLGCDAHSDGDVLIHALIDALFGALAKGDIGDHFPPSDPQYNGISSTILLKKCLDIIRSEGYAIVNIDCVINLEEPKLFSYKLAIRENLAKLLSLDLTSISLKAKTHEQVDAVGQSLAVSAQVIVLLSKDIPH